MEIIRLRMRHIVRHSGRVRPFAAVYMAVTVTVAMAVTMHIGHFFMFENSLGVPFHQRVALADDSFCIRMLGDIADLLQCLVQGIMTLAVTCSMTITVAMRRRISGECHRCCNQSRCK